MLSLIKVQAVFFKKEKETRIKFIAACVCFMSVIQYFLFCAYIGIHLCNAKSLSLSLLYILAEEPKIALDKNNILEHIFNMI